MRAVSIVLGLILLIAGFALSILLMTEATTLPETLVAVVPGLLLPAFAIHLFNDGLGQLLSDFGLRKLGHRIGKHEGFQVTH